MAASTPGVPFSRTASLAWISAAYVCATLVALAAAARYGAPSPAYAIAVGYVAGALTTFVFSRALNNSSVFDAYWSVAPLVAAPLLATLFEGPAPGARRAVVAALVVAWGVRLTYNWLRGFPDLSHEDWRYVAMREKTGRLYWLVSLLGLHLAPTGWITLGSLSLAPALVWGGRPLNALDALALAVTAGAIALEAVADAQLHAFRARVRERGDAGAIMAEGLWAHSRHPNYLGELLFWWGLFLFALASAGASAAWPAVLGPASITALFVFVSVPMLDKRSRARRPAYAAHEARVPALFPWRWLLRLGPRDGAPPSA